MTLNICLEDCLKDLGFELIRAETPPPARRYGEELEIDVLAVAAHNGKPYIIVIEVKSYVNHQKIDDFIKKRLLRFKEFFIDYKDLPIIGAIAGVRYAVGAQNKAQDAGLYVFKTSKGFLKNVTPVDFKPKFW